MFARIDPFSLLLHNIIKRKRESWLHLFFFVFRNIKINVRGARLRLHQSQESAVLTVSPTTYVSNANKPNVRQLYDILFVVNEVTRSLPLEKLRYTTLELHKNIRSEPKVPPKNHSSQLYSIKNSNERSLSKIKHASYRPRSWILSTLAHIAEIKEKSTSFCIFLKPHSSLEPEPPCLFFFHLQRKQTKKQQLSTPKKKKRTESV